MGFFEKSIRLYPPATIKIAKNYRRWSKIMIEPVRYYTAI